MRPGLLAGIQLLLSLAAAPASAQYECEGLARVLRVAVKDTSVVGTVLESGSRRPLPDVSISVDGGLTAFTDCAGHFALPRVGAGPYVVSTWSLYFYPDSTTVTAASEEPQRLAFTLRRLPPAPPPTDSLLGAWTLTLFAGPKANENILTTGSLVISPGRSSPLGTFQRAAIAMDYAPLQKGFPWPDPDSLDVQIAGDTVRINLTPHVNDAGFSLSGFIHGGMVSGTWCERHFAGPCTSRGSFLLERRARS